MPLVLQRGCEPQVSSVFNINTSSLSLACYPFPAWTTDLWPQLKNTHNRLTFTGNEINSRFAPWDKVLLFSGNSSLPSRYQITFNAFKHSVASLTLVVLGGLAGSLFKTEKKGDPMALFSVAGCLMPARNEEMTNKSRRMGNLSSN